MNRATDLHDLLLARIASRSRLDDDDQAALRSLPLTEKQLGRYGRIICEGSRSDRCGFIVSGYAYRSKTTHSGGRSLMMLLVPGDLIDMHQIMQPCIDHDVESLTSIAIAEAPTVALREVVLKRPAIARALWTEVLAEASLMRELILSNSRRDAQQRVAHQLCEFAYRLGSNGQPSLTYDMPLTQDQLGDMTGLTGVHVNRTLRMLRDRNLIERHERTLFIIDWQGLKRFSGFRTSYLHLGTGTMSVDQSGVAT